MVYGVVFPAGLLVGGAVPLAVACLRVRCAWTREGPQSRQIEAHGTTDCGDRPRRLLLLCVAKWIRRDPIYVL